MPIEQRECGAAFDGEVQSATRPQMYRDVYVGSRVTGSFPPEVWRSAVDELLRSYGQALDGVTHRTMALSAVCRRLSRQRHERADIQCAAVEK